MVNTGGTVPARYLDNWLNRARSHLTARPGARPDLAVQQAVDLYQTASRLRRAHLEAYLLTGEPLDVVAGRCDLPVPTVEAYANLFFAINRKARDKIALIIGPGLAAGLGDQEPWRLWMAFAYHVGLVALDTVIRISIEDGLVEGTADLPRTAPPVTDKKLRRSMRLALNAMMLPPITSPARLAKLHAQARRITSRPRRRSVPDALAAAPESLREVPDLEVLLRPEDPDTDPVA
jgi:hypothetical protein